jgi:hypothetical protein
MNRLRPLGNGKRDQALDRVLRAMAGRSKRSSSISKIIGLEILKRGLEEIDPT